MANNIKKSKELNKVDPKYIASDYADIETEKFKHPLYKKLVILTLFVEAVYYNELINSEVSEENPYLINKEHKFISNKELDIVIEEKKEERKIDGPIFLIVRKMPKFPGGELALRKFIADNINYSAFEGAIQGTVYVKCVITKTGKVAKPEILRGVDPFLDKEAIRIVKSLPDFVPGAQSKCMVYSSC